MLLLVVVALLPWILLGIFMAFFIREPRPLPPAGAGALPGAGGPPGAGAPWGTGDEALPPLVSVIVPARNEARNIVPCLESLVRQDHPRFEVVVVDDRSEDATAERARAVPRGNAQVLRVVEGSDLPEGWFGKPWACRQGADAAAGEILLFTDADTTHGPDLLTRALAAMEEDRADVLSLLGDQEMGTFAERLVQPQVFALLGLRFHRLDRVVTPGRWTDAIANGQYILVRKPAYTSIGGHDAVRGEVVEDLRLAQELVRAGHRLSLRLARDAFSTRMYTSLQEVVNGWTKNVAVGARQSSGRLAPLALPGLLLFLAGVWLVPPAAFLVSAVGALLLGSGTTPWTSLPFLAWGGAAAFCTVAIQAGVYGRFGVSPAMALLHPLGALVMAVIVVRSWIRGEGRIEWKGRRYSGGEVVPVEANSSEDGGQEARSP